VSRRESAVRVGLVYPELLGTYGDRGNGVVLVQRARWRGIPAELVEVKAGEPIPDSLDVYIFGGGEDDPMQMAAAGMRASEASIERAHANGAAILAVCGGYQLIGHRYIAADGEVLEGIGIVDLETRAGSPRLIGELVAEPTMSWEWGPAGAPATLTGFENHGGRTTLGPGVDPLGKVVAGGGNGDGSGTEGVLGTRIIGTYLHGSVLPRNPQLADRMLWWVTGGLPELDSELERRLHDQRVDAGSAKGLRKWWQDRLLARG
jgi:lipid II isoglutaminyl synthase (glutamine-hydrolysing)